MRACWPGIMGHNLCLDIFGGPSAEEAAAGLPVHGEASLVRYELRRPGTLTTELVCAAELPLTNLQLERRLALEGRWLRITESVQNPPASIAPIGWTQHVTLGPPFLKKGVDASFAPPRRDRRCSSRRSGRPTT